MKKITILTFILFGTLALQAQKEDTLFIKIDSVKIHSVLTQPKENQPTPLVIFIAGSGPTDLNGNSAMTQNNSLLYLSDSLVKKGMATFRFDKRGIAKSAYKGFKEKNLTIDRYVNDLVSIVQYAKKEKGFRDIYLLGHSEGSLIALIALQQIEVDGFISLAGAGSPADEILRGQLKPKLPEAFYSKVEIIIDSLKQGHRVKNVSPQLYNLFRPSVQPYMISWFKYNPVELIRKIDCPVLVINGTKDLQVGVKEAEKLAKASNNAKLVNIKNMNHVLKTIEGGQSENIKAYSNPELPVNQKLVQTITEFINSK
jgi:hypothetical protein